MKRLSPSWALLVTVLVAGCGGQKSGDGQTNIPLTGAQPGEVVRLDDYPLYYTHISSDYGFDAYRRQGMGTAATSPLADARRPRVPWGCTCFSTARAAEGPLFGRNFDFQHQASLLLYTSPPHAFASLSMVDLYYVGFGTNASLGDLRARPDTLGRAPYYPMDGVNEKGVAIGLMSVPSASPPVDPAKVTLYDLALIRLVLDYSTDADHAVELLRGYNYRPGSQPVHFLIADRGGASVLVEYVGQELKVIRTTEPYMVATNFTVSGSQAPRVTGCGRYDLAYSTLRERNGVLSHAEALGLLSGVAQNMTMWSAVYDLEARSVHLVPGRRYQSVYRFSIGGAP
jgi:hypothetical protein